MSLIEILLILALVIVFLHLILYVWDNHIETKLKSHKISSAEKEKLEREQDIYNILAKYLNKASNDVKQDISKTEKTKIPSDTIFA